MSLPAELRSFAGVNPSGYLGPVARQPAMSRERFVEAHMRPRVPVILPCLSTEWPCSRWTLDDLARRLGPLPVEVSRRDARDGVVTYRSMAFSAFVEAVTATPPEPLYLFASVRRGPRSSEATRTRRIDLPSLAEEVPTPDVIDDAWLEEINSWVAFDGAFTPLHFDPADNLLTVLQGRKHVLLFSPDESRHLRPRPFYVWRASQLIYSGVDVRSRDAPSLHRARYMLAELHPGDSLFIPTGYWHAVRSFDVNVAVNHWWDPPDWLANWLTPSMRPYALRNAMIRWPAGVARAALVHGRRWLQS